MSQGGPGTYEMFLTRYNSLKALYFSPKSNPVYDDDGEEIPSAFMGKAQICKIFLEEMKVHVPVNRMDPPKFLDGTIGPSYVEPTPAPQAPVIETVQDPELMAFQARQRAEAEAFHKSRQQKSETEEVPHDGLALNPN